MRLMPASLGYIWLLGVVGSVRLHWTPRVCTPDKFLSLLQACMLDASVESNRVPVVLGVDFLICLGLSGFGFALLYSVATYRIYSMSLQLVSFIPLFSFVSTSSFPALPHLLHRNGNEKKHNQTFPYFSFLYPPTRPFIHSFTPLPTAPTPHH
ncbi:hypothetical protein BKA80DRAFT_261199 [Phyllosticta citrichinensis]